MIQNVLVRILLAPFSLLYGMIMGIRNTFYETEILKSSEFSLPVISVGNLTIGGTGKTPHVEYLTQLLRPYLNVSILSRGYKRKTKGFQIVTNIQNSEQFGDEPSLYKLKYPDVVVAVSESRAVGIPLMLQKYPYINVVLLDDAFQHRSVKPGLSILLTTYDLPFTDDYLLPMGRLRESRKSYNRADIIIVSKCPDDIPSEEKEKLLEKINPQGHQQIFFTKYRYNKPYSLLDFQNKIELKQEDEVILLSAIANTDYLESYLDTQVKSTQAVNYEDHHYFTERDMVHLKQMYENLGNVKKYILTSEKDAVRLFSHRQYIIDNNLPIFVLPIEVAFLYSGASSYDLLIKDYLLNFKI